MKWRQLIREKVQCYGHKDAQPHEKNIATIKKDQS